MDNAELEIIADLRRDYHDNLRAGSAYYETDDEAANYHYRVAEQCQRDLARYGAAV